MDLTKFSMAGLTTAQRKESRFFIYDSEKSTWDVLHICPHSLIDVDQSTNMQTDKGPCV